MSNCEVKVKRSDEEELFHSDTFLGDEFLDEMYHWKYIKKKKVNGKWRYYYNKGQLKDDLGFDELKTYNKAKSTYENAAQKRSDTKQAVDDFERRSRNYSYKEYDYDKAHDLYRSAIYWKETAAKRGQEYMSARTSLKKTPVGKLVMAKETIGRGAKAVARFGKKLFKIH